MDDIQASLIDLGSGLERDPLLICLKCGNEARHEVLGKAKEYIVGSNGDVHHSPINYILTRCSTCDSLGLFTAFEGEVIAHWPKSSHLGEGVPSSVEKYWHEALALKGRSPNAFAVATRRALEAMCLDRGVKGRDLAAKLESVAKDLPKPMPEVARVSRLLGNRGAHAGADVSQEEADVLNDFFLALIEYVYVAPSKLKRYDEALRALATKSKPT